MSRNRDVREPFDSNIRRFRFPIFTWPSFDNANDSQPNVCLDMLGKKIQNIWF